MRSHFRRLRSATIVALLLGIWLVSQAAAQAKTDFSGTWVLNESKSELGDFGGRFATTKIQVSQTSDSIKIVRTAPAINGGSPVSYTETLPFDGKEVQTEVLPGISKKKSSIKWSTDGTSFVITSTTDLKARGQNIEMSSTEIWSLSADGNILTSVAKTTASRGESQTKAIYEKSPK